MVKALAQENAVRVGLPQDVIRKVARRLVAQKRLRRPLPAPFDADVGADSNAIHQTDRRPQWTAGAKPARRADFGADHFRNAPPDFNAGEPRRIPTRAVGSV